MIIGAGGLGLMALSLLKAMGGKGAIVVDIDAKKREAAEKAGALATVDGKARDALAQLAQKAGGPIRAVIDLVGNAQSTQLGFDCLTKGGKLIIVGLFGGGAPWALPLIPIKAVTIQGSYVGNLRETRNCSTSSAPRRSRRSRDADAARQGQRRAARPAEGQAGRPRGADAVGSPSSLPGAERRALHPDILAKTWIRFASPGMTTSLYAFKESPMSANDAFHVAVLAGDGIGPEVMAPALEVLRKVEAKSGLNFRFTDAPAGANHYRETGKSMPDTTVRLCEEADAILLGACGLPSVRYPDNTEIMPQVELRFHFDLYAGVRPARLIPGVPSPIVGADQRGIDLVVIREFDRGPVRLDGQGRRDPRRCARDAGHHAQDLGAAVRVFVQAGRAAQGARPARAA